MTKEENIFDMYFKLSKNGARYQFLREWAGELGRSFNTLKNHWVQAREIPKDVDEEKKDWAIKYLQNAIALENK